MKYQKSGYDAVNLCRSCEMTTIPRPIKKSLRHYADLAYQAELNQELLKLSTHFDAWKNGQIDSFELSDAIHRFHNGPSVELYKKYNYGQLDLNVAYAIVTGLLNRDEVSPEVLDYLRNAIAFYESQSDSNT